MKDNKDEQFPVVDEMGNIVGAISRGWMVSAKERRL